jgi:hypothetical protein
VQRRKAKGGAALGAVLAAFTVLVIPPAMRCQQAGTVTPPRVSDAQQNPLKTDASLDRDSSSGTTKNPLGDAGQQPSAQEPATQQSGVPTLSTDRQKARLGVNPVTGMTVSPASNFTPLTGEERWKLYWKQNFFSVGAYLRPTFFALVLDQAPNSPSQWGGGFSGFGLREASRVGSNLVQGTIRTPLAAVLHEDVRYISDQRGGNRRILHAVVYSFLTYNNQGHPTLNVAKLVGYYASTAISTTWRPEHRPLASYTFANGSEQMGLSVPINILQEFWPDIVRKIERRRS